MERLCSWCSWCSWRFKGFWCRDFGVVERVLVVGIGVRVFGFKDVRVSLHVRMSGRHFWCGDGLYLYKIWMNLIMESI